MAILHKNITAAADIHNPKWFSGANNGDYAFKNEKGELESIDELLLPAALNFVDGSVAPPTTNSGDIYILSSGGSVNAGWGGVSLQDWVRYDGTAWNSITPQKSSLCYDKTADLLKVYDGSAWAGMGSSFGILGIADTSGSYSYYSTYAAAISAASSGDTIEQFGNITETGNVTVMVPSGVSINMNGYTYTLDGSDNTAFNYGAVGTKTKIINGTIIKQNSPTTGGGGVGLFVGQTSELDLTGLTVISDGLYCLDFNTSGSGQGLIVGGKFYYTGTATSYSHIVEGRLKNAFFNTGTGTAKVRVIGESLEDSLVLGAVQLSSNGRVKNVNIYNTLATSALNLADGKAYNCNVYSQSSYAIYSITANSEVYNSTAISESNEGIFLSSGKAFNCNGYSNATEGLFVNLTNAEAYNCTGESSAAAGIELRTGKLVNCTGISSYNNAAGHGIVVANNNGHIINCFAQVTNSGANAVKGIISVSCTIANLTGIGMTTLINANITNNQTNTPDAYGNILI